MWAMLRLGWRNIWRNRRRTLISMSAIGLGLTLVIVWGGVIAGILGDAKNQLDSNGLGHVELTAKGWRTHRAAKDVMPDADQVRAGLELPQGAQVSTRVVLRGLVSSAHGNEAVEVHGVDFADEATIAEYVNRIVHGAIPAQDDVRGLVVGEELAARLALQVGSKVKVLVQRADGEMGAELFKIRGVFHAMTAQLSRHRVLMTRPAATSLSGLEGAHQIVIQLEHATDADALAQRLRAGRGQHLEVATYSELFPIFRTMEALVDGAIVFSSIFVYVLVGLGILNTMLMSVLERTREFGVMQAVGTRPSGIVGIVLAESFWLSTLAVACGLVLGLSITWYGSTNTLLDYSQQLGEGFDFGGTVVKSAFETKFSLADAMKAARAVYVMALFVGLVPAFRVSRLRPVEALRAR